MPQPIVFLDKDGTLIDDVPYNADPARLVLAPGAAEGLRLLAAAGFRFAVVSNQSGVARGFFTESQLARIDERLCEMLGDIGVSLAGFFYCPHHPDGVVAEYALACDCRKPAPGLIVHAARQLQADLRHCWMIGDILDDVEAGRRAGCRTVLIDNGNETEWKPGLHRFPDYRVNNLAEAARTILRTPVAKPSLRSA
jgi:D-glycero-D-manno-heptose 1,7-bisphosphate phosphatase